METPTTSSNPTEKLAAMLKGIFTELLVETQRQLSADTKKHFEASLSALKAENAIAMQQSHAPLLKKLADIDLSIQNLYGELEELKEAVARMAGTTPQPAATKSSVNMPGLLINESPTDDMFKSAAVDEFEVD